jgi:hypothetical protein
MDFIEEYNEMSAIPIKIAVTYKFFELFRVSLKDSDRGIHWSTCAVDTKQSDEVLEAFKAYIKTQRSQLKKCDVGNTNCGKMLWFFYQKLLEFNVFDADIRREILKFMEVCEYIIL